MQLSSVISKPKSIGVAIISLYPGMGIIAGQLRRRAAGACAAICARSDRRGCIHLPVDTADRYAQDFALGSGRFRELGTTLNAVTGRAVGDDS